VIDGCSVYPAASVRNLGVYEDCDLSMRAQVARTTSRCFASLRQLYARYDTQYQWPFQSVFNASAPLIYRLGFRDHITDALISLHLLRVRERIEFKLATLTYKLLHNQAPSYLGLLVHAADVPGRRALRSANTDRLI